MTFFACVSNLNSDIAPPSFRSGIESKPFAKRHVISWVHAPGFLGAIGSGFGGTPASMARWQSLTSVGMVRLDNRDELMRLCKCTDPTLTDLDLILRLYASHPALVPTSLFGDFGFVIWNSDSRRLLIFRDSLGVRRVFYRDRAAAVSVASRADLLAEEGNFNTDHIGAFIACRVLPAHETAYAGVRALPPATSRACSVSERTSDLYWDPIRQQQRSAPAASESDSIATVRSLLIDAVRIRMGQDGKTWSHLSGGMDSSSVVSVAQWLFERGDIPNGLQGTITYSDPFGLGADETMYSDSVAEKYRVPNHKIPHQHDWSTEGVPSDLFDQPINAAYMIFDRDRQVVNTIQGSQSSILLTGFGSDNLFLGTMLFFADWMVTGRARRAVREMAHRAAVGRVSFWELAYKNAILPLLPSRLRTTVLGDPETATLPWIPSSVYRRLNAMAHTNTIERHYGGHLGHKYAYALAMNVEGAGDILSPGILDAALDVRHPFLYRPLVDFSLTLPAETCVRPYQRKWILREAMRGILPERVRARVGKGSGNGLMAWAANTNRNRIERLLDDSILAELGLILPKQTRHALDMITARGVVHNEFYMNMIRIVDVELWLRMKTGRWVPELSQSCCA